MNNFSRHLQKRLSLPQTSESGDKKLQLHQLLKKENLDKIKVIFKNDPKQKFDFKELHNLLQKFNINLNEIEYKELFQKIDTNQTNVCNWEKFITFLGVETEENDLKNQKLVLTEPISEHPTIERSTGQQPICGLIYCPSLDLNGKIQHAQGSYVTVSKIGEVKFLSHDLKVQRSKQSKIVSTKYLKTWIKTIEALPDIQTICVISTDREIRFYDLINFELQVVIKTTTWPGRCLSYFYGGDENLSKLFIGDDDGSILVIEFVPKMHGPFRQKIGRPAIQVKWKEVLAGAIPETKARQYLSVHFSALKQIRYSENLHSIFSCAECYHGMKKSSCCLVAINMNRSAPRKFFYVPRGIVCFDIDEKNSIIVTGGSDSLLRLWNPFDDTKLTGILQGHRSGIAFIFIQSEENKIYSIDNRRTIKVWNLKEQKLIQNYLGLIEIFPYKMPLHCYYNRSRRELIVGHRKIVLLNCSPKPRSDLHDGETHKKPVSVVLYNSLFKYIVTCGHDSKIMIWDPWVGHRVRLIEDAHIQMLYGDRIPIEITSACFNPMEQFLLTAAKDGTLKIWKFPTSFCMRHFSITPKSDIAQVLWFQNLIFAVGGNRNITEFVNVAGAKGRSWVTLHSDRILCARIGFPDILVSGSNAGEIIFWRLETNWSYKKIDVNTTTKFKSHNPNDGVLKFEEIEVSTCESVNSLQSEIQSSESLEKFAIENKKNEPHIPVNRRSDLLNQLMATSQPLAVTAMIFLETRHMLKDYGSLVVALKSGVIQIYPPKQIQGCMEEFVAIHVPKDYVVSMATDKRNQFLFTATEQGYIKTWHLVNFGIPENEKVQVSLSELRLQFCFLFKNNFEGAKRSHRYGGNPLLLNSFKGHTRAIYSIVYIDQPKIIVSGSADKCARLWSLGGRYLGTLGTFLPWKRISFTSPSDEGHDFRIPPDIKKVASSTTSSVLTRAEPNPFQLEAFEKKVEKRIGKKLLSTEDSSENKCIYGKPLVEPLLGKHFKLPQHGRIHLKPVLDKSLPHIPVYSHLEIHPAQTIERPSTPEVLKRLRNMDL